ncbi:MAG: ANTAR domain-containing protein [Nocardioidaceae bacterium]
MLDTVAASLSEAGDLSETLIRITHAARDNVPGADQASVSVRHADGHVETVAPTDQVAERADQIQYELREGPCYDVLIDDEVITYSADLANESRWSKYGPRANALGLGSQMAIRLTEHNESYTGLNLYSRDVHAFDDTPTVALLFSSHAKVALGYAQELESLNAAVMNRQVIGQAVGIVVERYGLNEERAFEFLVRVSQTSNTKLRDVAADIVKTTVDKVS